jgi:hypothetical protein
MTSLVKPVNANFLDCLRVVEGLILFIKNTPILNKKELPQNVSQNRTAARFYSFSMKFSS